MAIADKALLGFGTMEDLWRQEITPGEDEVPLQRNELIKEPRVSRNVDISERVTNNP